MLTSDKETATRAFQFFNLNNEEDRQGLIELITGFLDKLTGGQTVDTRGHADGLLESVWSAIQYLLDTFDGETRAVDLNTRFDMYKRSSFLFVNFFCILDTRGAS